MSSKIGFQSGNIPDQFIAWSEQSIFSLSLSSLKEHPNLLNTRDVDEVLCSSLFREKLIHYIPSVRRFLRDKKERRKEKTVKIPLIENSIPFKHSSVCQLNLDYRWMTIEYGAISLEFVRAIWSWLREREEIPRMINSI